MIIAARPNTKCQDDQGDEARGRKGWRGERRVGEERTAPSSPPLSIRREVIVGLSIEYYSSRRGCTGEREMGRRGGEGRARD